MHNCQCCACGMWWDGCTLYDVYSRGEGSYSGWLAEERRSSPAGSSAVGSAGVSAAAGVCGGGLEGGCEGGWAAGRRVVDSS